MTAHTKSPNRHASMGDLNNSLIFQFILADLMEAYEKFQKIDILSCRKSSQNQASVNLLQNKDTASQIQFMLHQLVGSKKNLSYLPWNLHEGTLARLKSHCLIFAQNADNDGKEFMAIQHYAEKTWQHCLQILDLLHEMPDKCTPLFAILEKACGAMHRFAKLIPKIIHQFKEDENVIFFVLRHHQQLDKLYGKRFIYKLFSRIYPNGMQDVQNLLNTNYLARNFDNITPVIARMIAELEMNNQ